MAENLIRLKQINQADLSGAVQNVIASNQYEITYGGGTGININDVGQITISGTDIYLIDSVFNVSGTGVFNALDLNNIDTLSLSGVDINIISGNVTLTNRPTVNGTGVLLSGQNSFVIQMSSSSSNLTTANTMYYFSLGSQGYAATNRKDREFPFLDPCIVKKVSFSIQQLSSSTVGFNVTGFFINSTKNLTGIIFSGYTTSPDGNLYTFSRNDLNIPFAEKDSGVCAIFSTTANPTNIRSMVNAYCYN